MFILSHCKAGGFTNQKKENNNAAWQVEEVGEMNQSKEESEAEEIQFHRFPTLDMKKMIKVVRQQLPREIQSKHSVAMLGFATACNKHSLSASLVT